MTLPIAVTPQVGELPGLRPLSLIKADLTRQIEESQLDYEGKQMALRELDFLIRLEQLRRVRSALWQWQDERNERVQQIQSRRQQHMLKLLLDRQRARAEFAEIQSRLLNARVDLLERVRRIAPSDERSDLVSKARRQLLQQQLNRKLSRNTRRQQEQELSDMIAARGRFARHVREHFPDMEDELMDKYDEQLHNKGVR